MSAADAAMASEVSDLRQEVFAVVQEACEVRAKLEESQTACERLKGCILTHLDAFDDEIARVASAADIPAEPGRELHIGSPVRRWRRQRQQHPVDGLWDWPALDAELRNRFKLVSERISSRVVEQRELQELRERCSASASGHTEAEMRLSEHLSRSGDLESRVQSESAHLRCVESTEEQRLLDLRRQLHDQARACSQAKEWLDSEELQCASERSRGESGTRGITSETQHSELELEQLVAQCRAERSEAEVLRTAGPSEPDDGLWAALEQRDAAVWRLNEQLLEQEQRKEAATRVSAEESTAQAALSRDLQGEAAAISRLEAEAEHLRESAALARRKLQEAQEEEGEECRGSARHLGSEIAALEAELRAADAAPLQPDPHSSLLCSLQAMREALGEESREWRLEAEAVRRAARERLRAEVAGSTAGPRGALGRGPAGPGSGCRRALEAWDAVLCTPGEEPRQRPALEARQHRTGSPGGLAPAAALPDLERPAAGPPTADAATSVAQALDTLDAFTRGRTSKHQAEADWNRLADAEDRRVAMLAAQREKNMALMEGGLPMRRARSPGSISVSLWRSSVSPDRT